VESKLSLGLAGLRPPGPRRCSSFSYSSLCVCARLNTSSFPRALSFLSPLPLGWPLPFIGWERGQPVVASLGRSRKAGVKLVFYLGWSHAYSWGSRLPDYLVFTMADDVGATMVPYIIITATSTPGLRSLGLGATRQIVPYGRSVYSGLVRYAISVS
jgi:hypothetical protein